MDGVSMSPERHGAFKREKSVVSQCFHQASTGCHAKAKTILPYYLKREENILTSKLLGYTGTLILKLRYIFYFSHSFGSSPQRLISRVD